MKIDYPKNLPPVPFVLGPTAVGKTMTAIELARKLKGEIISIDSRQVFRGMTIGTAKPTMKQIADIPHHLIDILNPNEQISAGGYRELALKSVKEILNRGNLPIFVGGSGMYVKAMIYGIFNDSITDNKVRDKIQKELKEKGAATLYNRLVDIDPEVALKIHVNNVKRITRALEIYEITGKPPSQHYKKQQIEEPFPNKIFILNRDRKLLYNRINERVDEMIGEGLIDEVRQLLKNGSRVDLETLKTLGYQEIVPYLDDKCSKEEMIENLKQNTRRYAKRQLTWFRHQLNACWIEIGKDFSAKQIADHIMEIL